MAGYKEARQRGYLLRNCSTLDLTSVGDIRRRSLCTSALSLSLLEVGRYKAWWDFGPQPSQREFETTGRGAIRPKCES